MRWEKLKTNGMDFLPRYNASSVIFKDTLYILGGITSLKVTKTKF